MDKLPVSYSRRPKPVYVLDGKECYVSSYYDQAESNEQHPFGKTFSLQAWDVPGETIDQHERKTEGIVGHLYSPMVHGSENDSFNSAFERHLHGGFFHGRIARGIKGQQ